MIELTDGWQIVRLVNLGLSLLVLAGQAVRWRRWRRAESWHRLMALTVTAYATATAWGAFEATLDATPGNSRVIVFTVVSLIAVAAVHLSPLRDPDPQEAPMPQPMTRAERRATTQQRHPWRATLRTIVQVAIALGLAAIAVGPEVAAFIGDYWPGSPAAAWIIAAVAFLSGLAGLLARLAALPAIDRVLELVGLGSAPEARR